MDTVASGIKAEQPMEQLDMTGDLATVDDKRGKTELLTDNFAHPSVATIADRLDVLATERSGDIGKEFDADDAVQLSGTGEPVGGGIDVERCQMARKFVAVNANNSAANGL